MPAVIERQEQEPDVLTGPRWWWSVYCRECGWSYGPIPAVQHRSAELSRDNHNARKHADG